MMIFISKLLTKKKSYVFLSLKLKIRQIQNMGHILENIVYLELLRRDNEIYIGKQDNGEVDFMAINERGTRYYQVALTVRDETTLKRELAPLNRISDHNPKYLLTLDGAAQWYKTNQCP